MSAVDVEFCAFCDSREAVTTVTQVNALVEGQLSQGGFLVDSFQSAEAPACQRCADSHAAGGGRENASKARFTKLTGEARLRALGISQ